MCEHTHGERAHIFLCNQTLKGCGKIYSFLVRWLRFSGSLSLSLHFLFYFSIHCFDSHFHRKHHVNDYASQASKQHMKWMWEIESWAIPCQRDQSEIAFLPNVERAGDLFTVILFMKRKKKFRIKSTASISTTANSTGTCTVYIWICMQYMKL